MALHTKKAFFCSVSHDSLHSDTMSYQKYSVPLIYFISFTFIGKSFLSSRCLRSLVVYIHDFTTLQR
jgi:hypothetical protein